MKITVQGALLHSMPYLMILGATASLEGGLVTNDATRLYAGLVLVTGCVLILMQASLIGRMRHGRHGHRTH